MKLNRKLRKLSILHNKAFLQVFVLLIAVFVVSVLWSKFSKYALPSKSVITSDQLNQIKPASFKPSKALFKERKNALKNMQSLQLIWRQIRKFIVLANIIC